MRAAMDAANINLDAVADDKLREFAAQLVIEVRHAKAVNEKLTHEMAVLKRLKYASSQSEGFSGEQKSLLQEAIDEDLEALSREVMGLLARAYCDAGPACRRARDVCAGNEGLERYDWQTG